MLQCLYVFINYKLIFSRSIILWVKDRLNVFLIHKSEPWKLKHFVTDAIYLRDPMVPEAIFPTRFHLLRSLAQQLEESNVLTGQSNVLWVTQATWVVFALPWKRGLDREVSFPRQMCSASWHPERAHGWLQMGSNIMVPRSIALFNLLL